MHEVLVNRLGGLSLPRKSVVRLTDRPDMTLDVYRGRKTTIQPTNQPTNQPKRMFTYLKEPAEGSSEDKPKLNLCKLPQQELSLSFLLEGLQKIATSSINYSEDIGLFPTSENNICNLFHVFSDPV